jgi:hypothetical protein
MGLHGKAKGHDTSVMSSPIITECVRVAEYLGTPKQFVHVVGNICDDQQQNVTDVMEKLVSAGNTRTVCLLTRYNVHSASSMT